MRRLLALTLLACAEPAPPPMGLDAGRPDSGRLFADPTIAPERFDCRNPALPARPPTALPLSAGFDPTRRERLVVAHRSAGGTAPGLGILAPENTMSALRAAIVMGADFVETDPRATRDGVLVNFHDPELSMTTTATGPVSARDAAEILALPLRYPSTIEGDFSCDRIITIRELLVAAKGRVNVLLDANKIGIEHVPSLVALVRETDTFAEAVFDTSSLDKIARARALEPNLKVQIRPDRPEDVAPELARVGQPPPVIVELDLSDLPRGAAEVRRLAPGAKVMSDSLGGLDLSLAIDGVPPPRMTALWDDAELVQTDRPDLLLRALGR